MTDKIIDIIKNGNVVIPYTLLSNYTKIPISDKSLIILIYLLHEKGTFNPQKIAEDLHIDLPTVLTSFDELSTKELVSIDLIQKNGKMEETLNFDGLYKKLGYLITNEEVEEKMSQSLYDIFEQEFGRSLSPIEYELINGWLEADFTEEVIQLALKEAVYNGVSNLRYIDKILYEWKKKNIMTKEAILKDKENFQNKKAPVKKELIDYDWLNEDE